MPNKPSIYLDHAAATPMDKRVLKAMQPYFSSNFYNPSASYLPAVKIRQKLGEARAKVAKILGAKPAEIIFTAGGTEANNLAIFGIANQFNEGGIVSTLIEHDSVLEPLAQLKKRGHKITLVHPDKDGIISPDKIAGAITPKTVLVSIMLANNEIGAIQPLSKIAKVLQKTKEERRKKGNNLPLYFHTDAAQAPNYLGLQAGRLGVDLMTLNGGKIYGPKQSGVLYVSSKTKIDPLVLGGGQERGLRSGTENVPAIIGLATALEMVQNMRTKEAKRMAELQDYFVKQLKKKLPSTKVNGSLTHRLPNNIHITIPGSDNERLMLVLDEMGVQVGLGSACSASNEEPSHVLSAIGLTDEEARSSLRITMGRMTTKKDIDLTINALVSLLS